MRKIISLIGLLSFMVILSSMSFASDVNKSCEEQGGVLRYSSIIDAVVCHTTVSKDDSIKEGAERQSEIHSKYLELNNAVDKTNTQQLTRDKLTRGKFLEMYNDYLRSNNLLKEPEINIESVLENEGLEFEVDHILRNFKIVTFEFNNVVRTVIVKDDRLISRAFLNFNDYVNLSEEIEMLFNSFEYMNHEKINKLVGEAFALRYNIMRKGD